MTLFVRNLLATAIPLILSILLSLILDRYGLLLSQHWPFGVLFLVIIAFVLNTVYGIRAAKPGFTQLLLGALIIKLLLALIGIVVYSFINRPGFFNFSARFIFSYILFTIFEIRYLLQLIKIHPPHTT